MYQRNDNKRRSKRLLSLFVTYLLTSCQCYHLIRTTIIIYISIIVIQLHSIDICKNTVTNSNILQVTAFTVTNQNPRVKLSPLRFYNYYSITDGQHKHKCKQQYKEQQFKSKLLMQNIQSLDATISNNTQFLNERNEADFDTQHTIISNHNNGMQLLQSRLQSIAKYPFTFVKNENDAHHSDSSPTIHIKTLVWEAKYSTSPIITNTTQSIYFVTALQIHDKVDLPELHSIVTNHLLPIYTTTHTSSSTTTTKLQVIQLAKEHIAEVYTGYSSGSMPPICHTKPMPIFIDQSIIQHTIPNNDNINNPLSSSYTNDSYLNDCIQTTTSIGSGSFDYSLELSLYDLIQCAHTANSQIITSSGSTNIPSIPLIQKFSEPKINSKNNLQNKQLTNIHNNGNNIDTSIPIHQNFQETSFTNNNKDNSQSRDVNNDSNILMYEKIKQKINTLQFHQNIDALIDLLASYAKKKNTTEIIHWIIEALGESFPMAIQLSNNNIQYNDNDNCNDDDSMIPFGSGRRDKNALHLAAWKGDLNTIELLLNTCKQYPKEAYFGNNSKQKDVINIVSRGAGNYGKSPIFYAITQCRDDVVLYLIQQGANLLIVNNKGQSPCSMAVTHLKPETCNIMYETELAQLKSGGVFTNYRQSHSDGRRYGDLDPRFVQDDDVNMDEDIRKELNLYKNSAEFNDLRDLPRSVRPTTRITRMMKWQSISTLKFNSEVSEDSVTLNKPRYENSKLSLENIESGEESTTNNYNNIAARSLEEINTLKTIKLRDILSKSSGESQQTYELIDDYFGVLTFRFAVDDSLNSASHGSNKNDHLYEDDVYREMSVSSWGLDCEWKPATTSEQNPVATLQVSSLTRSFVLDLQTICQAGVDDENIELTEIESILSEALSLLFRSSNIYIIGFGASQDITKMALSFPHMPCFREFNSVIDLFALSRQTYPHTPKTHMISLQKMVVELLGKRLDKSEQCSEWDVRPLRHSQLEYASLDAAILPYLFQYIMNDYTVVNRLADGNIFRKFPQLLSSYRFTYLGKSSESRRNKEKIAYRVSMGSVKTSLKVMIARQVWPSHKTAPRLPEIIHLTEEDMMRNNEGINNAPGKSKESKEVLTNDLEGNMIAKTKQKGNKVKLCRLTGDLDNMPTPGMTLGYTKESCIRRFLGKTLLKSLPENVHLCYNRRGGVIESYNGWFLFVNLGLGRNYYKYKNEFLLGGRQVTFTVDKSKSEEVSFLESVLSLSSTQIYTDMLNEVSSEEVIMNSKPVLLFLRSGTSQMFMYCGLCAYVSQMDRSGSNLVDLVLELKHYDLMKREEINGKPSTFMGIINQTM